MTLIPAQSREPFVPSAVWLPWQSGRYYFAPNIGSSTTSATLGNGTVRCMPFMVPNQVTLSRIGGEVTSGGDAGCKVRLGIYADDGAGRPGALVVDAGTIAGDSATVQEITINVALAPGVYYSCGVVQLVTVTQPTVRTWSNTGIVPVDAGTTLPTPGNLAVAFNMTGITGALPATASGLNASGTLSPRIVVKVA